MISNSEAPCLAMPLIPCNGSSTTLHIYAGKTIFIVGRNGTGKSALVHRLSGLLGDKVVYMPGSRPSYFDSDSLQMTPSSRRSFSENVRNWDANPDTRVRPVSGTTRNEKAIHDLQNAETQFKLDAANQIKLEGRESSAISRLQSDDSPLDRVNAIFSQANLPISLIVQNGELRAKQQSAVYSYAKMSDGERSALVFAAEVVAAPGQSIFLIDEPELHLHPAIVVPFLKALIAERPDCGFVVCTHELELPSSSPESTVVLVRSSQWQGDQITGWDIDVLSNSEGIPESLLLDILGSRRKFLFIEGTSTSLDQPLYALLFPQVSIRPRVSCRDVKQAVDGLRIVQMTHRVEAFGLVDHDGMSTEEKEKMEAGGVYPLPIFAVESLYYCDEVFQAVAIRQANYLGLELGKILDVAKNSALAMLKKTGTPEHLASRIAERQMRDKLLSALPSRNDLALNANIVQISFNSPYPAELDRIKSMIEVGDLAGVIARYPIRETGVLDALSKSIHFSGRGDYERAVLTTVGSDEVVLAAVKAKLGELANRLEQP